HSSASPPPLPRPQCRSGRRGSRSALADDIGARWQPPTSPVVPLRPYTQLTPRRGKSAREEHSLRTRTRRLETRPRGWLWSSSTSTSLSRAPALDRGVPQARPSVSIEGDARLQPLPQTGRKACLTASFQTAPVVDSAR